MSSRPSSSTKRKKGTAASQLGLGQNQNPQWGEGCILCSYKTGATADGKRWRVVHKHCRQCREKDQSGSGVKKASTNADGPHEYDKKSGGVGGQGGSATKNKRWFDPSDFAPADPHAHAESSPVRGSAGLGQNSNDSRFKMYDLSYTGERGKGGAGKRNPDNKQAAANTSGSFGSPPGRERNSKRQPANGLVNTPRGATPRSHRGGSAAMSTRHGGHSNGKVSFNTSTNVASGSTLANSAHNYANDSFLKHSSVQGSEQRHGSNLKNSQHQAADYFDNPSSPKPLRDQNGNLIDRREALLRHSIRQLAGDYEDVLRQHQESNADALAVSESRELSVRNRHERALQLLSLHKADEARLSTDLEELQSTRNELEETRRSVADQVREMELAAFLRRQSKAQNQQKQVEATAKRLMVQNQSSALGYGRYGQDAGGSATGKASVKELQDRLAEAKRITAELEAGERSNAEKISMQRAELHGLERSIDTATVEIRHLKASQRVVTRDLAEMRTALSQAAAAEARLPGLQHSVKELELTADAIKVEGTAATQWYMAHIQSDDELIAAHPTTLRELTASASPNSRGNSSSGLPSLIKTIQAETNAFKMQLDRMMTAHETKRHRMEAEVDLLQQRSKQLDDQLNEVLLARRKVFGAESSASPNRM